LLGNWGIIVVVERSRGKKLVYVSEDLLDAISAISKKKGESISKFVEDNLKEAVKVEQLGHDARDIVGLLDSLQIQRVLGGTFVPLDVLTQMCNRSFVQEKDLLLSLWFDSGKLYGKYIVERYASPITALINLLKTMRWDLNEVAIREAKSVSKFRCVSTSLNESGTDLLSQFIEGAITGMGFKVLRKECLKGFIVLDFSK